MDISRLKRVLAGISAGAIMVSQVGTAIAAYTDVPAGIWYEDAVEAFVDDGLLDASQTRFRGGDLANRAEFVKLIVELNGGILGTAPATPTFDDVGSGAWYYSYFEEAAKENWVRGDGSCAGKHPCYARPSANINRAEAAAIIVRAFPELEATGDAPQFADNPSGQWYTDVIQTAADNCVLQGDEGTGRVRPSDNMNRAEMVVMLHRVNQGLMYGEDCGGGPVAEAGISDAMAISANVVEVSFNVTLDQTAANDKTKYTISGPGGEMTISSVKLTSSDTVELTLADPTDAGAEYTVSVEDMMGSDGESFSDSATFDGYTAVVKGDGTLEVSASSKSPVGDTVPKGAVGVTMASVDLTATDDDVSLENLTVLHEGFGDATDISGVYAVVNGERVTRKRSFDSQTTTATIRFTKPLVIKRGETVTLDLAVDFTTSAATAAEHTVTVELASDFISNAKEVKGNFPIRGATFRIAAVTAGSISIAYRSVTPSQIKVGDKAALLGKFEFSLDSTEDQTIYSMTVENDGTTSDGDVTNLQITRTDGTVVANTVPTTTADFATFVFDPPLTILEGDKLTLNLRGDIVGGAAKTVRMHFDESSDIFAVGSLYGYGVSSQLYGSLVQLPTESATSPSTVFIDAGQFTINISGPTTQNYTPDDNDAVLANISFDSGGQEDVDIEELYIAIQGTSSSGQTFTYRGAPAAYNEPREAVEGVELRSKTTGRTISGIIPDATSATWSSSVSGGSTAGAYSIYRFDDFTIHGKENYEFRVDFIDNSSTTNAAPKNGDRFRIHICGEPTYVLDTSNSLTGNSTTCTFGGLVSGSTTYQMKITGASTNDRVGDVRPRGNIAGNFQDIKTSALTLTGRPQASTDVSVSNAKNINLLRFEARASEAKDVLLTDLSFYAGTGSLQNGNNYALWVDTNGDGNVDTVLESGVASSSGNSPTVTFSRIQNGGYVITKETTVVFEVHADIASSLNTSLSSTLRINFATGATSFVQAEEADNGSSLTSIYCTGLTGVQSACAGASNALSASQIIVNVASSTMYSLRGQGDLYVSKSSNPIRNRQLLGGKLEDEILRLQFHAEYEDIEVTDLIFTGSGTTVSANGFGKNVDSLELYKVGSTTPLGTATVGGCSTTADVLANSMCANLDTKQLVVPRGADIDILIRPKMKTDEQGAHSGSGVLLYVDPTTTSWSGSGAVRARGLQSSNNLAANDGNSTPAGEVFIGRTTAGVNAEIEGNLNRVVLSKVVSITNANPDPNGTAIASGTQPIGQFKFTAATHGNTKNGSNDWTLSGIIFNVNATNVLLGDSTQVTPAGTDFRLYNKSNNSVKAVCQAPATSTSANAQSGALVVICADIAAAGVNTEINSGEDQTFVLEALVSNPKIANTNSTLQVSLTTFTNSSYSTMTSATSHLFWKDKDSGYSTNFFWVDYPETTVNSTSYQS